LKDACPAPPVKLVELFPLRCPNDDVITFWFVFKFCALPIIKPLFYDASISSVLLLLEISLKPPYN